jgi:hypothetical protein
MGTFEWCIPDPNHPGQEICEPIPVKIDPTQLRPDPETLLGPITEELRTDIAVLVAVDQLATSMHDDDLRAYMVKAVEDMTARLASRLPADVALKRTG